MADGVAVLSSGGLDSAVMLVELCQRFEQVHPIYVRCGLFWEKKELSFLRAFVKEVDRFAIQQIQVLDFAMDDVYQKEWYATGRDVPGYHEADEEWQIPGRNIILTAKAAVWCRLNGIDSMAHGTLNGNPFADSSPEFFGLMEGALSRGLERRLNIVTPLGQLDKSEVVLLGRSLPLERTLSCPVPVHNSHCGICGKCRERISAFALAGVFDPTSYHENFQESSQGLQRLGAIGG
jgi:7-cyano-7-deazaguanine synthase